MGEGLAGDRLPEGLTPSGTSPVFERESLPSALQREHALADDFWGVLRVLAGSVKFEDLGTGHIREIVAPGRQVIRPRSPHRLIADGPLRCRIDFFKGPSAAPD